MCKKKVRVDENFKWWRAQQGFPGGVGGWKPLDALEVNNTLDKDGPVESVVTTASESLGL